MSVKIVRKKFPEPPEISDELYILSGMEFGDSQILQEILKRAGAKYSKEELYVTYGLVRPELDGMILSQKLSINFFLKNMLFIRNFFQGETWETELKLEKELEEDRLYENVDTYAILRQKVSNRCVAILSNKFISTKVFTTTTTQV